MEKSSASSKKQKSKKSGHTKKKYALSLGDTICKPTCASKNRPVSKMSNDSSQLLISKWLHIPKKLGCTAKNLKRAYPTVEEAALQLAPSSEVDPIHGAHFVTGLGQVLLGTSSPTNSSNSTQDTNLECESSTSNTSLTTTLSLSSELSSYSDHPTPESHSPLSHSSQVDHISDVFMESGLTDTPMSEYYGSMTFNPYSSCDPTYFSS